MKEKLASEAYSDDYLSAKEVAELLPASAQTILRWARAGKVPSVVLPSGRRLFRRSDIEALLEPRAVHEDVTGQDPLPGLEEEQ